MTKAVGVAQCGRGSEWAWLGVVSAIPRRGCPWGSEVHCLSVVNQAGCSTECQWQQVYRGYPVDEVANGLHPGSTPTRLDSGTEIRTRQTGFPVSSVQITIIERSETRKLPRRWETSQLDRAVSPGLRF